MAKSSFWRNWLTPDPNKGKNNKTRWIVALNKGGYKATFGRTVTVMSKAKKYRNYDDAQATAVALGGELIEIQV